MKKYTTTELKAANPITEKDKTIISNDAYAITDLLTQLIAQINFKFKK